MSRENVSDLITEIFDSHGKLLRQLKFYELTVGATLQKSFQKAFTDQFGHLEHTTLKTNFSAVRIFCKYCLETYTDRNLEQLAETEMQSFVMWLSKSGRVGGTSQSILNIVRSMLAYAARNKTGGVPQGIDLGVVGFRREEPSAGNEVTSVMRTKILAACRAEIELIEGRVQKGKHSIAEFLDGKPNVLGEMLSSIVNVGQGRYVKKEDLRKAVPGLVQKMQSFGFREVYAYLNLSPESIFPFYLAIIAETGGNPEGIHNLKRDCFIRHPTKPDFVLLVWSKKRSHAEQVSGSTLRREWSSAGLVKKLLGLNENLVSQANPVERDRLFVAMSNIGKVGLCCTQLLHVQLAEFTRRHNLEKFTFRDLRRSVAEEEYLNHKDIDTTRDRLGHARSVTTQGYLRSSRIRQEHERTIVKYSGLLYANAKSLPRKSVPALPDKMQYAETVFGFGCSNPLAGIAPGSQKGRVCDKFYGCSTCPGAIVILDNPRIVAKLLSAAMHLRNEKKGLFPQVGECDLITCMGQLYGFWNQISYRFFQTKWLQPR